MLRISCPAHWAASTISHSIKGEDRRQVEPLVAHWMKHADGLEEILLALDNSDRSSSEDLFKVTFQLTPTEQLFKPLPEPLPGTVKLWLDAHGSWRAQVRPGVRHALVLPAAEIDELWLPGSGMYMLPSLTPGKLTGTAARRSPWRGGSAVGWQLAASSARDPNGRFSRQAGALDWRTIESIRQRRFALVGCGRNGHAMAMLLATYEPREIVLIDPDVVEPGNLDAGLAFAHGSRTCSTESTLTKVSCLGKLLSNLLPYTRVTEVPLDIFSERAARAAANCDVIISATDDDGARFRSAVIAQAFLRVHLDLGSLVARDALGALQLGADVRLMLPGDRDLCCMGGFASVLGLEQHALGKQNEPLEPWQSRKAGALTSWSTLVAGLAFRLLEDLASGRLQQSHWARMTQLANERTPRVRDLTAEHDPYCPLCQIAGRGHTWSDRTQDLAAAVVLRARR